MNRSRVNIIFLFIIFTLFSCSKNPDSDKKILAVVGDRIIDQSKFVQRLREVKRRLGNDIPDTGQLRRQILRSYVEEEILIDQAIKRGFDRDAEGKKEWQRIQIQELLNAFHKKHIQDKIRVTEAELKQLFIRLNTRLKARHLYARTRQQADSLYEALQHGATFEELAKAIFKDPRLRDSGGLLGYFTVDEMEPAFEEAAYKLPVGQISRPVKTTDGYSIILVEDRVSNPLVTETEFARHRDKLAAYWRKRKILQTTQKFVDSLRNSLHVRFNESAVRQLYTHIRKHQTKDKQFVEESVFSGGAELKNVVIVQSDLGKMTLKDLQKLAQFTGESQKKWILSTEHLKDFIAGLVVREYMLRQAKKEKLQRTSQYRARVQEAWENYLLQRMEETLKAEMVVPEDSLRSYYKAHADKFAYPAEIRLREIVLKDKKTADRVARRLKQGADFSEMARRYSTRRETAYRGGDLGYLTAADLGSWAHLAFSMKIGEFRGPLRIDSSFVFLKCVDKKPARQRTFYEARKDVEQTLRWMYWPDFRKKKIAGFRQNLKVKIFENKLRNVRLN